MFAAELRRLHDGGAHLVRGFPNFSVYAEHTFDGLTASAAKQLSRQGGVLLALERHGRVELDGRSLPVATTALRALSVVDNALGEQAMLAVYDRALELRPDRAIVEQTVKAAAAALHSELTPPAPSPEPTEGGVDAGDVDEDDELPEELPDELAELVDRLDILRRHIDDLRLSVEDPVLARRELRNVVDEVEQVQLAMALAYGDDQPSA